MRMARGLDLGTCVVLGVLVTAILSVFVACSDDSAPPIPEYAKPSSDSGYQLIMEGNFKTGFNSLPFGLYAKNEVPTEVDGIRAGLLAEGWTITSDGTWFGQPFQLRASRNDQCLRYDQFEESGYSRLVENQFDLGQLGPDG